jgi:DNA-binding response OmpR family regulator
MPRTILLADDSPTIRKIVELTFSDSDLRVECAENGAQASEMLRALRPDLVLADVVMPDPSGYELCREVKRSDKPVPVILLAGTFEPFDAEQAQDCGADAHLVKPFESETLRAKVESLLGGGLEPAELPETASAVEVERAMDELSAAEPAAEPVPDPEPGEATASEAEPLEERPEVAPELVEAVTREVVKRLSQDVLREIAWEVVPDLAAKIIRERIRELESSDPGKG